MIASSTAEVTVTLPSDREIVFTRFFSRPRQLLFEAWTKPEHLRRWYGCEGSALTVCETDLRVNGTWKRVMRMADGSDHAFHGVYREIVPNERLVYTECYEAPQFGNPEWLTTVTFEDVDGMTKLTHTLLHSSREIRDGHLKAGMEAGTIEMLNRLDELTGLMAEAGVRVG